MNHLYENREVNNFYDADTVLREISECTKEISRIKKETAKSVRLLKDCARSEEEELKNRIESLKGALESFARANRDKFISPRGESGYMDMPGGIIGFKKHVSYRTLNGSSAAGTVKFQVKTRSENRGKEAIDCISRIKLNKLTDEALEKIGIVREKRDVFYIDISC